MIHEPHKTKTHRWMEPHSEKEEMVEPHDSPSQAPQEGIVTTLKDELRLTRKI